MWPAAPFTMQAPSFAHHQPPPAQLAEQKGEPPPPPPPLLLEVLRAPQAGTAPLNELGID